MIKVDKHTNEVGEGGKGSWPGNLQKQRCNDQWEKYVNSVLKNCKLKQNEIPDSPCKEAKIAFLHMVIHYFRKGVGK